MSPETTRRVVILDDGYAHYDAERAVLAPLGAELVLRPCRGDAEAVRKAMADADAVLVRESPVDAQAIATTKAKVIVRYGVGHENIDGAAAARRGIPVCNVPAFGTDEVSDHAIGLLLAAARRIVEADRRVRSGAWGVPMDRKVYRLRGGTLGLIGYGRIGQAVHRKAAALGLARVLVHDPFLKSLPEDVEPASLERIARESDVISLHAPATNATRHIVGRAFLAQVKPTAILVNTARGALVDEAALAAALAEGRLLAAGLDVFAPEPLRPDSPLRGLDNVVLTDHAAWYSEQAIADLQREAAEEVARVLRGEAPLHQVNKDPFPA
ncbi:C-terminal binding protein [Elioraea sp.]|uniref:C-terminal binding protein n=1 Tax=Elioraea sp. TaxID=2185103 RepID=UPI0021DE1CAD|nr:C-terminal binding protein [Elioraea sp.]GIX09925.1 MAG: dehydrogenase [Elioraea sp.]